MPLVALGHEILGDLGSRDEAGIKGFAPTFIAGQLAHFFTQGNVQALSPDPLASETPGHVCLPL